MMKYTQKNVYVSEGDIKIIANRVFRRHSSFLADQSHLSVYPFASLFCALFIVRTSKRVKNARAKHQRVEWHHYYYHGYDVDVSGVKCLCAYVTEAMICFVLDIIFVFTILVKCRGLQPKNIQNQRHKPKATMMKVKMQTKHKTNGSVFSLSLPVLVTFFRKWGKYEYWSNLNLGTNTGCTAIPKI